MGRVAIAASMTLVSALGCARPPMAGALEARAPKDLECAEVTVMGPAWPVSPDGHWAAFGCGRVAHYACTRKEGFRPVRLGGPAVVESDAFVCVRGWVEEASWDP